MSELQKTLDILYKIYNKHRKKHPENSFDSEQMCLMWSTNEPPDEIEGTTPLNDIEEAFDIEIPNEVIPSIVTVNDIQENLSRVVSDNPK